MNSRSQMDKPLPRHVIPIAGLALLLALLTACGPDAAAGPDLRIEEVWSRPAVALGTAEGESDAGGMGGTGAVFMKLANRGREVDRLIGAQTDVAEVVEIHETRLEGDVMRMQHLPGGLEIPAGKEIELKPGSYHVMLIGLWQDLNVGDQFTVRLSFEKSGTVTVRARVREP